MLSVKTTPNLYGISLRGDYTDLNEIYDALSRYLDFYQRHSESYPYHEYEYLLSLNYDIVVQFSRQKSEDFLVSPKREVEWTGGSPVDGYAA